MGWMCCDLYLLVMSGSIGYFFANRFAVGYRCTKYDRAWRSNSGDSPFCLNSTDGNLFGRQLECYTK